MQAMKRRDLISLLNRAGFFADSRGKHEIFRNHSTGIRVAVPQHREVSPGTIRDILRAIAPSPMRSIGQ